MAARGLDLAALLRHALAQRDATAVARTPDPRATQDDADRAAQAASVDSAGLSNEIDRTLHTAPSPDGGIPASREVMENLAADRLLDARRTRDSTARDAASRARDLAAMMRAGHLTDAPARPRAVGKQAHAINTTR